MKTLETYLKSDAILNRNGDKRINVISRNMERERRWNCVRGV